MSYAETETGCTQQYLTKTLPNSNPNIKKRIPQHQNTNSMYPKSMKRIATHNREVAKIGRTHNSLIYYHKVKISWKNTDTTPWCTTSHEFHPVLATHTQQQLQAPYHPFSNISRPLFRTTYKAITSFSLDATMLTGPKPCFPSEGTEPREAL